VAVFLFLPSENPCHPLHSHGVIKFYRENKKTPSGLGVGYNMCFLSFSEAQSSSQVLCVISREAFVLMLSGPGDLSGEVLGPRPGKSLSPKRTYIAGPSLLHLSHLLLRTAPPTTVAKLLSASLL
jgi:hypothetical protein